VEDLTDRRWKSKGNDAILKEQLETSPNVDATLRGFIKALSQGQTQMRELLSAESASIKEVVGTKTTELKEDINARVVSESERTRDELSTQMRELAIDRGNEAACGRLVQSIKYATMNERFNQIAESHNETCEWILKDGSVVSIKSYPTQWL
jgi:hypothetical protein